MEKYYLRKNNEEECYQIMELKAISDDGTNESAVVANIYDLKAFLEIGGKNVKFLFTPQGKRKELSK